MMKHAVAFAVIYEVALLALIGFLCWLFKNGWPCLLILFSGITLKSGNGGGPDA